MTMGMVNTKSPRRLTATPQTSKIVCSKTTTIQDGEMNYVWKSTEDLDC